MIELAVYSSSPGKNDPLVLTRMEPLESRSGLLAETGKVTWVSIIRAGGA